MPELHYLNKELHTAGGRRALHEPRRTDLQKVTREARIQARKRLSGRAMPGGTKPMGWLEEGMHLSLNMIQSCLRQTREFTRQHPLRIAAGAVVAGVLAGMLMRRR
ncbi:MAG TPA: DUF883 C-terminal domain-containing protein [Prosthecobacter sp.]|nr:DUF883 C-terminal domain-containing protein [Prosthecobacter sp.]